MTVMFRDAEARTTIEAAYERFRASLPSVESRTVDTKFGRTHLLVGGPPDGAPLVLLHGALASSAHVMRELGPLLQRYRVYAPDIVGVSVKSAEVRLPVTDASYGEWIEDTMNAVGLARAHVYGVSWGGFVARLLAERAPERIDRLVLLVPAGIVTGPVWRGFTEVVWPMMLFRAFPSEERLRRFASGLMTSPDDEWVRYFGEAFRGYRLDTRIPPLAKPEALASFSRPTLVFGASDDVSFPGAQLIARARELFQNVEVELLENCRHAPPTDEAFRQRIGERIIRFLQ